MMSCRIVRVAFKARFSANHPNLRTANGYHSRGDGSHSQGQR